MQPAKTDMEYRKLGNTGIKVSAVAFGPQMYMMGAPMPADAEEVTFKTLKRALELGVNYIDVAEFYGNGVVETHIGNSLKKLNVNREDIVISTKIFLGTVGGVNSRGCSRKRLIEGLKNSLKRLQTDYVDIVFASRYDYDVTLEEVCRAMDHLIRTERTLYWGTSEWNAQQITEAIELCEKLNLYKPVTEQSQYNMIHRDRFEVNYAPLFDKYRYGTTIWSPLSAGFLTGKLLDDPKTGRLGNDMAQKFYGLDRYLGPENIEKTKAMFNELKDIAKSLDATLAQLALAWVLRSKDVSTIICAFTKVEQVDENIKAVQIAQKFTPEIDEKIEKVLGNRPRQEMDWSKHGPRPNRR